MDDNEHTRAVETVCRDLLRKELLSDPASAQQVREAMANGGSAYLTIRFRKGTVEIDIGTTADQSALPSTEPEPWLN